MDQHCGTQRGLDTHENRNEPPCRFCLKFKNDPAPPPPRTPARRRVRALTPPPVTIKAAKALPSGAGAAQRTAAACGTTQGYARHYADGEKPCANCKQAKAIYDRAKRYEKMGKPVPPPRQLQPCGTYAAYRRHLYGGETVDTQCAEAAAAYMKKYPQR